MRNVLWTALLLAACKSSSGDAADASLDARADANAVADAAIDVPCTGAHLSSVSGHIVDESGAGIENAFGQLCLKSQAAPAGVCLAPPPSTSDGAFRVDVPAEHNCILDARMRVLAPSGVRATSYTYLPLTSITTNDYVFDTAFIAYDVTSPVSLPTDIDRATLRDVDLGNGLVLSTRPTDFFVDSDYPLLAARLFDAAHIPAFLPERETLAGVYAFRELVVRQTGITLRIDNALGLAANTDVELLALGGLNGTDSSGVRIPEGEWHKFATARVNAGGTAIENVSAPTPALTWLAVRAVAN